VDRDQIIHRAQAPAGCSARRIAGLALVLGTVLLVLPAWGSPALRLLLGAVLMGATAAQQYGRQVLLTRGALLLLGPLGRRAVPLQSVRRLRVGRCGVLSRGVVAALLSGDAWLPGHWSGVELCLSDGTRLFAPAADARALADSILRLCPQIGWDDLSENDYFAFLAQKRPRAWPRSTRSCIPSGSIRSSGSGTSPSAALHA
jgi:hypothetical protein